MNKNSYLVLKYFFVGLVILLFFRQTVKVDGYLANHWPNWPGPDGVYVQCTSWALISRSETECKCHDVTDPMCGLTTFEYSIGPTIHLEACTYCIRKNECGTMCLEEQVRPCDITPVTNEIYMGCEQCTHWVIPTPCQRCLTLVPTQPVSCQCQELTPIKDETNHTLGFQCLVKTSNNLHITDYTMTVKKPDDSLANLKSNTIDSTSCPKEESGKSCYKVATTTIDASQKGTYTMVVPPQIICQ